MDAAVTLSALDLDAATYPSFDGTPEVALGLTMSGIAGTPQPDLGTLLTLSAEAANGNGGVGNIRLRPLEFSGTLLPGSAGSLAEPLPVTLTLDARAGITGGVMAVASLTATGSAIVGSAGRLAVDIASVQATGTMADLEAAKLRAGSMPVAGVSLAGAVVSGSAASGTPAIGVVSLVSAGEAGGTAAGAFSVPAVALSASGWEQATIGSGTLVLPALRLVSDDGSGAVVAVASQAITGSAFVMNARTGALTQYSNFSFNSFAVFNGEQIAAGPAGLYALTGDTDAGTPIEMVMTTPISNFGVACLTRVREAFICYRSAGRAELHVKGDDGDWLIYQMDETRPSGIYRNRVKTSRGIKASYWQFSVKNVAGADLAIDSIEPSLEPLTARTA